MVERHAAPPGRFAVYAALIWEEAGPSPAYGSPEYFAAAQSPEFAPIRALWAHTTGNVTALGAWRDQI